ncbi:MAG: hypothetical protein COC24_002090 [Alphaproteobacteria bacterium]|nr:hypothetical protein [Alphaproteobacteria bacterium]
MNTTNIPIGADELAFARGLKTKASRLIFMSQLKFYLIGFCAFITLLCLSIEYQLLFSIIDQAFGADLETDQTPTKVYILSLSSLAAIIGFHVLMIRGDAPIITIWLRTIARFMVAFYFVGMFILLATNDLDSIISGDFDDAFINLDDDQDSSSFASDVLTALQPYFGLLTSLALGGLVFINLAITDTLVGYMHSTFVTVMEQVSISRRIIEVSKRFSNRASELTNIYRRMETWEAVPEDQIALENAAVAEAVMKPTLLTIQKLHMQMTELEVPEDEIHLSNDEPLPTPLPKPETLQTFITKLKKLIADLPTIYLNQK